MTSTKPAPRFYNHNETEEKKNSALTSDSDTMENDKSSSLGSFKTTDTDGSIDLDNISEFGDRIMEEKDFIAKRKISYTYFTLPKRSNLINFYMYLLI